jgi:hypothetical protein
VTAPSVREISARIRSPAARAAYEFWMSFWTAGRLPSFQDVDPAKVKKALPYLWVLKYDRASDRFAYRIAGEEVNSFFRRNMSGRPVDGSMPADLAAAFQARARRVVQTCCALHLVGKVYRSAGYEAVGERLYLPLAPSRADDGGVLGITDARGHDIDEQVLREVSGDLHVIRDGAYLVYDAALPDGAPAAGGTPTRP